MSLRPFSVSRVEGGVEIYVDRSSMIFPNVTLEQIREAHHAYYHEDKVVQQAFHFLNADQREFLMTGMTPYDWDRIFPAKSN